MHTLILILLSIIPNEEVAEQTVDLIELNYYYQYSEQSKKTELIFKQLIIYEWYAGERFIKGWLLVKDDKDRQVRLNHETGFYECLFEPAGGYSHYRCKLKTKHYLISHTLYDPELESRSTHPNLHKRLYGMISRPVLPEVQLD